MKRIFSLLQVDAISKQSRLAIIAAVLVGIGTLGAVIFAISGEDGVAQDHNSATTTAVPADMQARIDEIITAREYTAVSDCSQVRGPYRMGDGLYLPAGKIEGLNPKLSGNLACAIEAHGHRVVAVSQFELDQQVLLLLLHGRELAEVELSILDGSRVEWLVAVTNVETGQTLVMPNFLGNFALLEGKAKKHGHKIIAVEGSTRTAIRNTARFLNALIARDSFPLSQIGLPDLGEGTAESLATADTPIVPPKGFNCRIEPPRTTMMAANRMFYNANDKREICNKLIRWRTESHPVSVPDKKLLRRLLILSLQDRYPEEGQNLDVGKISLGGGYTEHTLSGARIIVGSLVGGIRMHTAIRRVDVLGCGAVVAGNVTCRAKVETEYFVTSPSMPESTQKQFLEKFLSNPGMFSNPGQWFTDGQNNKGVTEIELTLVRKDNHWSLKASPVLDDLLGTSLDDT